MFEQDLCREKMYGCSFHQPLGEIWVGFCLNTRKRFALEVFVLKPRERAWILLKTILGIYKIALRLRDGHVFMWQPLGILNVFTTLCLKLIFWKTKTFFEKLEHRFLVQITNTESVIFPHKTAQPEANVKINRIGNTKWTYHKGQSFASNYYIFLKILCQSKNLLQRVDQMYDLPKCTYSYLS